MNAIWAWFRLDIGRRWRSMALLALLVALASGTVMTAVAGARRGSTALDRLLEQTKPATIVVLPNQPHFDWDSIRALPEVEALTGFAVSVFGIEGVPTEDFANGFPETDTEVWNTIERPLMLEGRVLDPAREDEVMATPQFLSRYGHRLGDTLTLRLYAPEQVDRNAQGGDPGAPEGPSIQATIVGVPRSFWFTDRVGDGVGAVLPSPALFLNHEANFLGTGNDAGVVNALVRLRGGRADIETFKADLARASGRDDIDVWDLSVAQAHSRDVAGFEASSLLAFAAAAAIAALFLVGQSVVRHTSATLQDLEPMRSFGMTPGELRKAVALGPVLAGVAGWVVGAAATVIASRWFPIGTAAPLEPAPGVDVDFLVMAAGLLAVLVLLGGGSAFTAWIATRARAADAPPRRSGLVAAAVRAGMPVPVVVGARFALEPGKGRTAVPVRPALFGATVGVLGVLAAFTFSAGINDAVANPQRFGVTYDLAAYLGANGFDFLPPDDTITSLAADPDVTVVDDARMDVAQVDGVAVSVFTLDPVDRPLELVMTHGRPPSGLGEIVLAPRSAKETGLAVGDTVAVTGSIATHELKVSGIGFVPAGPHNDYASGGWLSAEAYDRLFDGFKFHFALVGLRDGADAGALTDRLAATGIQLSPPDQPSEVAELLQVRTIPLYLAVFLIFMALGAVGHALATATQRRSHDLAVLRALGMNRRQSRLIVVTQATLLALIGLAVGIPLGTALGRTVWRYVAERTPLFYLAPGVLVVLLTLVPVALIAANLLAVLPSRRAARLQLAQALRTE